MSKADEIWTTKDGKKIKVKDMTTEHIKNTIKCIEDGRIQFTINLGWAEDNDYQIIDEDTSTKYKWLEVFNQELQNRVLEDNTEEIEELKRYEEGNMYTYKYTEIPEKINELVKAVNEIRKENKK